MPSIGELSLAKVRALCEELERLLKPPIITPDERDALHASDVPTIERTKDDWWRRYAELRSYARRKEKWTPAFPAEQVDEGPLHDVELGRPIDVKMNDGSVRTVRPASWMRILVVEDLWYWLGELEVMRQVIQSDPKNFDDPEDLLKQFRAEISATRGWLYTQVCAPGPEPVEMEGAEPQEWALRIGPGDHLRLLDAWMEMHIARVRKADMVIRQKYPAPKEPQDGEGGTMCGFPFLFLSAAYRENTTPRYVMTNRDLPEVMTTYAAEAQKHAHFRAEAEQKTDAARARNAAAAAAAAAASPGGRMPRRAPRRARRR